MNSRFDMQLEELNTCLIKMGALCEEGLASSIKTLFEYNEQKVNKAEEIEKEIDAKERDIEDLCMKILIREHPVAKDLRVVSSAMKMISDMERIGDMARDIAELSKTVSDGKIMSEVHIKKMSALASKMLTDSVDAFVQKDLELARSVEKQDDGVDECFNVVKKELIDRLKAEGADEGLCLDALMVAKYLERIGDHAVNISQWVIYAITGSKG